MKHVGVEELAGRSSDARFGRRLIFKHNAIHHWMSGLATSGWKALEFGCGRGIGAVDNALAFLRIDNPTALLEISQRDCVDTAVTDLIATRG